MSSSDRKLVHHHLTSLFVEAAEQKVPEDVIGRLLIGAAIKLWRNSRSVEDITSALKFTIDNLVPDLEYPFMRP